MKPLYLLMILLVAANTCIYAQQMPPFIEWQKSLGGSGNDIGNSIVRTVDGGYVIAGTSTSNNGDVTGHHGPADSTDGWIVKISATGTVQWQRSVGGSGTDVFKSVIALGDGSFVCYGSTSSNDGDVTGNHGRTDIWVVKISAMGQLVWQKCYGGTNEELTGNMRQHTDGGFYFIATTASKDGDIVGNFTAPNYDIWLVKLDANGNLTQQYCIGGTGHERGYDIALEPDGGYIISGFFTTYEEIFPTSSEFPYGLVGRVESSFGGPSWHQIINGFHPVSITPAGGYYMVTYRSHCGDTVNTTRTLLTRIRQLPNNMFPDYRPLQFLGDCATLWSGLGYHTEGPNNYGVLNAGFNHISVGTYDTMATATSPHGDYDGFLSSITLNAGVNWRKFIGGSGKDYLNGINAISETEFIVTGQSNSNNGDVSGNHGGFDVWVVKFGTGNLVKGTVYTDMNKNGIKDANEAFVSDLLVESVKGASRTGRLTKAGEFSNTVDTGTYVTQVVTGYPYYTSVPASHNSVFTTYNNKDSVSFALQPVAGKKDYEANLFPLMPARPGFDVSYAINYANLGTDTLGNGTLTLIKDPRLTFNTATPAQTSVSGDTIRWAVSNLLPLASEKISLYFTLATPPVANLGDTLVSQVLIDSANDLTTANNFSRLRQRVTGAYDPNDKQEARGGFLLPDEYNNSKSLLYTIRFQNTGNDTAFNVVVRDTLSAKFNWSTFEMVAASHNYTAAINDGNKISWTFSNILLADSNVNEPASHGYITFRIKPVSNLQIGDTISNSASIYFDYNLPVKTNTQTTILIPEPPPSPVLTGLLTNYCSNLGAQKIKITNLPAGGSGITVSVKIDGTTVTVGADSSFSFNPGALSAGSHTVLVQFTNSAANRTSSSDFTITAAANPEVNISANITNITSLATNVIVTATNAAGGGTTPLYTFARDRNFTNISQPESAGNTWTFNPSILSIGDNRIYVRMKTSATCFVANTNIDSILLVRSSVTGITDPDMPGQVINIYPNPFKDVITINGLSSSKTYTISLFNLEGKQLLSKRVSGRTSMTLTRQQHSKGIYWLSIYDEKRNQLLGTIKMLKE